MKCDVLIVGAGPAGSSAAYACAAEGLDTIFIDKKKEVGTPITCSGAIGSYLIPFLPFDIPKQLLEYRIEGLEFFVHDISYTRKGGPWTSYAIDRSSFDIWLVKRAQAVGAELLLKTELVDLKFHNKEKVERAVVKVDGSIEEIEFTVLLGADGVNSTVLDKIGERRSGARIGRAVVYEYSGVELDSPTMDSLYFGEFAPGGYAHIFPLSKSRANIGVGSIIEGVDIDRCFNDFISLPKISRQLKEAKIARNKSGVVSFDHLSSRQHYGNVLLAGEAASQNIKPLIEGFLPAIICGDIAGKTIARHLLGGRPLEDYQKNLNRKLGPIFNESDKLTKTLEDLSDVDGRKSHLLLAALSSNVFSIKEVQNMRSREYSEIRDKINSRLNSRINRMSLRFFESAALSFLRVRARLNSKLYNL